jgi:Domain of unknown function (DUF397)
MEVIDPRWRKSSRSDNGGNCVEAGNAPGAVLVRDTTDRDGTALSIAADVWQAFTDGLK